MGICENIQYIGNTLEDNLNDRGVDCTFGIGTNEQNISDMAELITKQNLMGIGDANIQIIPNRPYVTSGETIDVTVRLLDGVGNPLSNKIIRISDGTNSYNGITDKDGIYTLFNQTITTDTTYTVSYGTETKTCTIKIALVCEYTTLTSNKTWDITLNDADFYTEFVVHPTQDTESIANLRFYNGSNQSFVLGDLYTNKTCGMNWVNGTFYGKAINTNEDTRVSLTRVGTKLTLTVGESTYVANDVSWVFTKLYNSTIANNSIRDLKLYLL